MAEEFEESEVIFPDQEEYNIDSYYLTQEQELINPTKGNNKKIVKNNYRRNNNIKSEESGKTTTGSVPVEIPIRNVYEDYWLEEEHHDGGELVPPHVIIGMRRVAGKMASSVCTGNGRTLKGRDLSQVRNYILKLTGFLET